MKCEHAVTHSFLDALPGQPGAARAGWPLPLVAWPRSLFFLRLRGQRSSRNSIDSTQLESVESSRLESSGRATAAKPTHNADVVVVNRDRVVESGEATHVRPRSPGKPKSRTRILVFHSSGTEGCKMTYARGVTKCLSIYVSPYDRDSFALMHVLSGQTKCASV